MADIRCESRKHGELTEQGSGILEIRCNSCNSGFRKSQPDVVVLHRWDLAQQDKNGSVKLIDTKRFKDPMKGNRK